MYRLVARSTVMLMASALAGSMVIFLLLRVLGGDIAAVILGKSATPESLASLRAQMKLDRPWFIQYTDWLFGIIKGQLGQSFAAQYDIADEIGSRLGVTLSLVLISIFVSSILALVIGSYSATNVGKLRSGVIDVLTQFGIAVPVFWGGLLLITFLSVRAGWFPAGGYTPWIQNPGESVKTLALPVTALTIPMTAVFARYVRSAMLDILTQDFMRTARAKGRTLRGAILVHGVRNASISLLTVGTLQLGSLLAGTVVIENVFALPGLGSLLMSAIEGREVIVVQSTVFVIMLLILGMNFLMDICYGLLDPRIRDAERSSQ
ncbi:peptide/nickel transport system permease protein [Amycolatopsis bartoniae]|uniref:Peptide ABC transporter n=1 Tax=Amycolatopsis bartoniae TaxID=941986 RepID=A0A8H9IW52_9PSEU|nr:ABC transporter permease [Amycolatopsis bartoniae]MBB2933548.1 peptide/nickel transport system permease protein [Amycolatopsis bartoniae]TVT10731.1 ABC transporter permease [Amycolatopsis bartoniae]GHF73352.1 peptide ABC transporter [Amycolatopsis bartoniae]